MVKTDSSIKRLIDLSIIYNANILKINDSRISESKRKEYDNIMLRIREKLLYYSKESIKANNKRLYSKIPTTSTLLGVYDDVYHDLVFKPNDPIKEYKHLDEIDCDKLNSKYTIKIHVDGKRCILQDLSIDVDNYLLYGLLGVPAILFAYHGLIVDGTIYEPYSNPGVYCIKQYCSPDENKNHKLRYYINDCFDLNDPKASYDKRLKKIYKVLNTIKDTEPQIYKCFFSQIDTDKNSILGIHHYLIHDYSKVYGCDDDNIHDSSMSNGVRVTRNKYTYDQMSTTVLRKHCRTTKIVDVVLHDLTHEDPTTCELGYLIDDYDYHIPFCFDDIDCDLDPEDTLKDDDYLMQLIHTPKDMLEGKTITYTFNDYMKCNDPYLLERIPLRLR